MTKTYHVGHPDEVEVGAARQSPVGMRRSRGEPAASLRYKPQ